MPVSVFCDKKKNTSQNNSNNSNSDLCGKLLNERPDPSCFVVDVVSLSAATKVLAMTLGPRRKRRSRGRRNHRLPLKTRRTPSPKYVASSAPITPIQQPPFLCCCLYAALLWLRGRGDFSGSPRGADRLILPRSKASPLGGCGRGAGGSLGSLCLSLRVC